MKCFYHTDMDGKCSAAIVKLFYPDLTENDFYPINYNCYFPLEDIYKDEPVIIVDFSLQKPGEFEKLIARTKNVTWIDHHITAIEKAEKIDEIKNLPGIRRDGTAGCELTWEYYFQGGIKSHSFMNKKTPKIVKLLGDYDVWAFKYGDETKHLQAGIRVHDASPCSGLWKDWFKGNYLPQIVGDGETITKYRDNCNKGLIKGWSFYSTFEGYKAICCNVGSTNSQLFDSVDEETYDIMIPFCFDGKQWTYSLHTHKEIDVSEIAKKYGGGGHKKAAGFQSDKLLIKK